ncbi:MAG: hypothetical protein LAN71_02730 [Acidobacteriia bacterium]|nr:hypothetical protein [Terriglobia bacterium]
MEPLSAELLDQLRRGLGTRERKMAICSGSLHLEPADRAVILLAFSSDEDTMIAERAQQSLISEPVESFLQAIPAENAPPTLFHYCARNLADKPGIADGLARNKNCPVEDLVHAVPHLTAAGVKLLMDELDRVSASHALAHALEHSTVATLEQKRLLEEMRGTGVDEEALLEGVAAVEPDKHKQKTLLERLSKMTVSQRVQLALKGGSGERRTLIRDSNKVVQRAVLQSPRLTDREVESFAAMTSLSDEILRMIANNRTFRKNYLVIKSLMNNPKTPLDVTMHMLPLLNPIDLKMLTTNKNVPETLRSTAIKMIRQRNAAKSGD